MAPTSHANGCVSGSLVSWTRCPSGIRPSRRRRSTLRVFRFTRSPSGRWRCITPGDRKTPGSVRSFRKTGSCLHRDAAAALGIEDEDWGFVESRNGGRLKCRARVDGWGQPEHGLDVERDRQAFGRVGARQGCAGIAYRLPAQPPHLGISARRSIPAGAARPIRDPVTGQAAWFDLTVRIERCPRGESEGDLSAHGSESRHPFPENTNLVAFRCQSAGSGGTSE